MGVGASQNDWEGPGAKEAEAPMLYYCCGTSTRRPSHRFGQLRMRNPSSTDEESDSDLGGPRRRRRSRPRRKSSRRKKKGSRKKGGDDFDEESDENSSDKRDSDIISPPPSRGSVGETYSRPSVRTESANAHLVVTVSDDEEERNSMEKKSSGSMEFEDVHPSGVHTAPQKRRKSVQFPVNNGRAQKDQYINNPHVALGTQEVRGALKKNTGSKPRRSTMPTNDRRVRFNHAVVFETDVEPHLPDEEVQIAQERLRSPQSLQPPSGSGSDRETKEKEKERSPSKKGRPKDTVIADVQFSKGRISDKYEITKVELGSGATGKVKLAQRGSEQFAVKIIGKDSPLVKDKEFLEEIDVLSRLDHPNLLHLIDVYDESDSVYLVTELHEGGELFDRILDKKVFPEKVVRNVAYSLVDALNYLHSQGIMHRDIKPENILFHTKAPDSDVIISDFGFAKHLNNKEQLMRATSRRGTMGYAAPEIFKTEAYTEKCDIWSLGVILYIMLSGIPPFCQIEDPASALKTPFWKHANTMKQVPDADVEFPDFFWKHVSDKAKHFIGAMLRTDPLQRMSAMDLLKHPFLKGAKRSGASSFSGDGIMNPGSLRGNAFRSMR